MTNRIDISDIVCLLTDQRRAAFKHEKHIALMTFASWLHYPNDPEVLEHCRILAAAACYLDSGTPNPLATLSHFAVALLDPPDAPSPSDIPNASLTLSSSVTDIVAFFLCCPRERKPSLNKAIFFVSEDGFPEIDDHPDYVERRSEATLKIAWRERAATAPFLYALALSRIAALEDVLPDLTGAFKKADRIVRSPKLIEFFGIWKFVQNRLLEVLDPASTKRLKVRIPKNLQAVECKFTQFDERQLAILAKYKAPRSETVGLPRIRRP